jgi:outer membrane protein OmpA-like peptidoglycan-associated protein
MRLLPSFLLLGLSSCALLTGQKPAPTYVVFFTEHSTSLDAAALKLIADAARDAKTSAPKTGAPKTVTVLGYTDSAGNATADQELSSERAESVASALIADGVASDMIRREGRGQTHEDPGVASRRVEIAVGD